MMLDDVLNYNIKWKKCLNHSKGNILLDRWKVLTFKWAKWYSSKILAFVILSIVPTNTNGT